MRTKLFVAVTLIVLAVFSAAAPAVAGGHTFEISGSPAGGDPDGGWIILDTGPGFGVNRYTIACQASIAEFCRWVVADAESISTVTAWGDIVKQTSNDALTQSVRFRSGSMIAALSTRDGVEVQVRSRSLHGD